MIDPVSLIVTVKVAVLVLGGTITYLAYRAARRTRSPALRAFAAGFAIVTVGGLLAGGVHQLLPVGIEYGVLVGSVLTALGFGVLVYSLYLGEPVTIVGE